MNESPTWPAPRRKQRTIVVAYGGRGCSTDALALGAWLARSTGDRPVVLTVYPKEPVNVLPGIGQDWVKSLQEGARDLQRRARETMAVLLDGDGGADFRTVGAASSAGGLDAFADRHQAAAIVVGSSGRGTQRRVSNNRTANRLFQGASVPVLIAPRGFADRVPETPLQRVGCAFVPTREGRHALRQAAALARRADARLEVFTVLAPGAEQPVDDMADRRRHLDKLRGALTEAVDQVVESLPEDVDVQAHLLDGNPVTALSALDASDCELLVCGSRGYGPVKRVLLGGVSDRLVRRAASPVMVVPRTSR